ncbi:MAG: type II toxin-antitoxin system YafQ family toxin [Rickettsiales bacterium]|nr:type II toxin-antitoxin system YafQ family toxin [Rickettsiales bacterium]
MKKIESSNRFEKELRQMFKRGKSLQKFRDILDILITGREIPAKYRDHKLQGEFKNFRDLHIEPDWVLIYQVTGNVVILERTGTHSDLFGS